MARPREFVRYVCSVCERPRTAPADLDVCPVCVWWSMFVAAEVDDVADPIYCEADGCDATTRHRKPYCSDHVELMPHVIWLLGRIHS